jgi:hypothetical protein
MIVLTPVADWYRGLSRVVKLIGYVGVVSGTITATALAWPRVEPYWIAHRGYVLDHEHPLLSRIIEIELKSNDARRERLLNEAPQRELDLQSPQAQQAPQYKALIQDRLRNIKQELYTIDQQNEKLLKEKGQ